MPYNLLGLHDPGGVSHMLAPNGTEGAESPGWVVVTEALGCDPNDRSGVDYRSLSSSGLGVVVRLNNGYFPAGTIPLPGQYPDFARRVAHFVAASPGCTRWIIGNEPQHANELPNGQPILPLDYADCYRQCRAAIHAVPGHERDEVIVAPVAPWDATCKYPGNPHGDWLQYMAEVLAVLLDTGVDALAIHSYVHGADPALIHSTAKMGWPFEDRYFHFLAYQDTLAAVLPALRGLPVYLTEFDNCDGPWPDVNDGLIQAMIMEVDAWNRQAGTQKIHSAICYRWSGDQWALEGKQQRLADFRVALALGIESPSSSYSPPPVGSGPGLPDPGPEPPEPPAAIEWDPRLTLRGASISPAAGSQQPAAAVWRCTVGRWFNETESQGRHHVFVDVRNADGGRALGVPIEWGWPGETTQKAAENKSDPWLTSMGIDGCAADFPMHHTAPTYWVGVAGVSDVVQGLGLGDLERPGMNIHTSYYFLFELVTEAEPGPEPEPPEPGPGPEPTFELVHPLPGSVITQHWGQNAESYARFGLWGHNGTDLGGRPLRTPVRSMAKGIVAYADFDAGYGHYVRVDHRDLDGYIMYCHLDEPGAPAGTRLAAGQTVGLLGSSGNSSGPHLHIEVRLQNKDGTYREDTPMAKGRVDPETWCCLHGVKL